MRVQEKREKTKKFLFLADHSRQKLLSKTEKEGERESPRTTHSKNLKKQTKLRNSGSEAEASKTINGGPGTSPAAPGRNSGRPVAVGRGGKSGDSWGRIRSLFFLERGKKVPSSNRICCGLDVLVFGEKYLHG